MTRAEFAKGSATFVAVFVAGFLSTTQVDRHFAAAEADNEVAKKLAANDRLETPPPDMSSGPCVRADGSWKNWSWSNVPTLSPRCTDDR